MFVVKVFNFVGFFVKFFDFMMVMVKGGYLIVFVEDIVEEFIRYFNNFGFLEERIINKVVLFKFDFGIFDFGFYFGVDEVYYYVFVVVVLFEYINFMEVKVSCIR